MPGNDRGHLFHHSQGALVTTSLRLTEDGSGRARSSASSARSARSVSSARDDQQARRARDIVRLLNRHGELRGVHAMADFIDDAVRWTA